MTVLAQSNWDTPGMVLGPTSHPWKTMVPTHCRIEKPLVPSPDGVLAVHAWAPSNHVGNVQFGTQLPQAPDLIGGAGWFVRWSFLMTAATLAATSHAGQIKLALFRTGVPGDNGFITLGEGWEFNSKDNKFASRIDWQAQIINTGPVITPDAWHEVGLWMQRSPGMGHAKVWYDGVIQGIRSHPNLGDDNAKPLRGLSFGDVYQQDGTPGAQIDVWCSNITVANAPIAPYMQG